MPARNQAQHYDDGYYNGPARQGEFTIYDFVIVQTCTQ